MPKRALVVGNGEPPSRALFAACAREADLILCADGGANTAAEYGYVPDFIVGDLDSVRPESKAGVGADHLVRVDADHTGTDMQKVLGQAIELGLTEAVLVGFTGGRTDHTLWNLSLLKTFGDELQLRMVDDYCDIRLVGKHIRLRAPLGLKLSLCPLAGPVEGIETTGLRFPLREESLEPGIRDGISNEVVGEPVEIRVGQGDLLLVIQREGEPEVDAVEFLSPQQLTPQPADTAAPLPRPTDT